MRAVSLLGVLLLASASARAGTLTNATWLQAAQGLPLTRTFNQLGATGTSTGTSIAVSLVYPAFQATLVVPKTANRLVDLHINVTQGGQQSITATNSGAAGSPGIPGTLIVMNAVHTMAGVNASMFMAGTTTFLVVPLSNGKAGTFTRATDIVGYNYLRVDFYGWTPHTLTFTGLTSLGEALPDVIAMGSFNLTPMGGGTVTLVSPSKVSIDSELSQRRTASFTTLVLSFVPEPGTLLLLGAGALALGLGGVARPR